MVSLFVKGVDGLVAAGAKLETKHDWTKEEIQRYLSKLRAFAEARNSFLSYRRKSGEAAPSFADVQRRVWLLDTLTLPRLASYDKSTLVKEKPRFKRFRAFSEDRDKKRQRN